MIKNIVFDFGGVLVRYDFTAFFRPYFSTEDELQWFMRNAFQPANEELDRGDQSPEEIIRRTQRVWPEYKHAFQALYDHYEDIFLCEMRGMKTLMRSLKARGYRLLGLSNWSALVERIMRKYPTIFSLLDGALISKDVHMTKPELGIYYLFLKKFRVRSDECVFIDDKPENILAAEAMGFYGVVFRNARQLGRELSALLPGHVLEKAQPADEDDIWQVVHGSALAMQAAGSMQWSNGYPSRQLIAEDIAWGRGHVLRIGGRVAAYMALSLMGEDAYEVKNGFRGRWITSGRVEQAPAYLKVEMSEDHKLEFELKRHDPALADVAPYTYTVMHRTTVSPEFRGQGLGRLLFIHAERLTRAEQMVSLRFDTNYDNAAMLHLARTRGYTRTGLCVYPQGERICFEKKL